MKELLFHPAFVLLVSTGIIFLLAALTMKIFPPHKINSFYGYRTPRSMRNQQSWDFAQKESTKGLLKAGICLLLLGIIFSELNLGDISETYIGIASFVLVVILLFNEVEKKLKNNFS